MNLYKVTYNETDTYYIVASSFGQAEDLWNRDPDRYEINNLELLSKYLLIDNS